MGKCGLAKREVNELFGIGGRGRGGRWQGRIRKRRNEAVKKCLTCIMLFTIAHFKMRKLNIILQKHFCSHFVLTISDSSISFSLAFSQFFSIEIIVWPIANFPSFFNINRRKWLFVLIEMKVHRILVKWSNWRNNFRSNKPMKFLILFLMCVGFFDLKWNFLPLFKLESGRVKCLFSKMILKSCRVLDRFVIFFKCQ